MKVLCPKCRALGLTTDCSDQLKHAGIRMINDDDDTYQLEATLTIGITVPTDRDLDPHQMAVLMREQWIEDPQKFLDTAYDAMADDYDLTVKPTWLL